MCGNVMGLALILTSLWVDNPVRTIKPSPPTTIGPITIEGVEVVRQLTADKNGVVRKSFMELELQFRYPEREKPSVTGATMMYRFVEINPVLDDTGRLLSPVTQARVGAIVGKTNPCPGLGLYWVGKSPVVYGPTKVRLAVPDRSASSIDSFSGKVEIRKADLRHLMFPSLNELNGKKLQHPDLKDAVVHVVIEPSEKAGSGESVVRLVITGNTSRVVAWYYTGNERWQMRAAAAEPREDVAINDGLEIRQTIPVPVEDGVGLAVILAIPHEAVATHLFDIRDIPLP